MANYNKWVACWGNATSITDRHESTYAKDITLRYPIKMCFDGDKIRLHLSNLTGTETVNITRICVYVDKQNEKFSPKLVTFEGREGCELSPGEVDKVSDEIEVNITRGDELVVSMYYADYTQMNSGVCITGPLSKGYFCYGDYSHSSVLPNKLTRSTNWFYFLNTIDIRCEDDKHALICYGDSITAQSWPDYLTLRCFEEGFNNVSIIRRAVSGTRILREYDCITYAAYGLKGSKRFDIETNTAGATAVIIQHGINDIIHPVGENVNIFRPWSDMPTKDELVDGVTDIYVKCAKEKGLKVYSGTLLPIYGWRTYEPFRDDIRNDFNEWLRNSDIFDGCVDFDVAVRDEANSKCFKDGYDSGDHLHPSELAYKTMAECVPEDLLV